MAGRRRIRVPLDVYLNGRLVGQLRRDASGAIDFRYDPAWLAWENTFPVKPVLVAEVAFTEWTNEGTLRHPSFQGLREDKPAQDVVREVEANRT